MSRDRYRQIMKFLRFSNPYNVSSDKNSRISDMDKICLEINKCFLPGKSLSLDESLLLHKGRLSFRMFIQTKRVRLDWIIFSGLFWTRLFDSAVKETKKCILATSWKLLFIAISLAFHLDHKEFVTDVPVAHLRTITTLRKHQRNRDNQEGAKVCRMC